ncbi:hypothetical protein BSKO_01949 [Bryopsis sp. KO-2023]|nr:hypothetical protein BSKO_01949 [Bryopsis sp. KO-2023]
MRFENPTEIEKLVKKCFPHEPTTDNHPLPFVIQEEGTGVRSIIMTPFRVHSFEGKTTEETHELLEEFLGPQAATAAARVWTCDSQAGDVLVWKNRQMIHSAAPLNSYSDPRRLHSVF